MKLKEEISKFIKRYGHLDEDTQNTKTNTFKTYMKKVNDDLLRQNKKYQSTIEKFLNLINKLNVKLQREDISIEDIKKGDNELDYLLQPIENDLLRHIKRSLKKSKDIDINAATLSSGLSQNIDLSEDEQNDIKDKYFLNVLKRNINNEGNIYNYYSNDRLTPCIACDLGINNSIKGYSPLMCSPNSEQYIYKDKTT